MTNPWPGFSRFIQIIAIYAGALCVGLVLNWLRVPLPFMIGALIFATTLRMSELPVNTPAQTRPLGQMLVASSVGLSFTPEAVSAVGTLLVPMVGAALLTVVLGLVVAAVLMRMAHVDGVTASLASVPIGPVESANLAIRHGVMPGPVVFAQTLRIMMLVILLPPAIVWLEGGISDPTATLRAMPWTTGGALMLFALAVAGSLAARLVGLSNPYFVGAIGGSALGAAFDMPLTAYPYPVLVAAQIFLGVWLGAVFDRELIRRAGSFVPAAFVSSLLMIALCVLMGLGIHLLTGQPWTVMVLSTAPGSVTEMALTAKILQEGIAVVTAFHLIRIFIILPSAPLLFRVLAKVADRLGVGPKNGG